MDNRDRLPRQTFPLPGGLRQPPNPTPTREDFFETRQRDRQRADRLKAAPPPQEPPVPQEQPAPPRQDGLRRLLKQRDSLRQAVILREILDAPKALRSGER